MDKQVVLITGASSGIGLAIADYLMHKGFLVYGTARRPEVSVDDIVAQNQESGGSIRMLAVDVCDEGSVQTAINLVISREGQLDILISNAGTGIAGSIEDASNQEAFMQFDINFFGSLRVIKAALPHMRKRGQGLIIAMSSVAGVIPIPYQGHYSSSKFALEGLIEALRHEIKPFGIRACLVEPGDTKTEFTSRRVIASNATEQSPYYSRFSKSLARMEQDEQNGAPPLAVAKTVYRVIKRKKPPIRVAVGFQYKLILFLKKILPSGLCEKIVTLLYSS